MQTYLDSQEKLDTSSDKELHVKITRNPEWNWLKRGEEIEKRQKKKAVVKPKRLYVNNKRNRDLGIVGLEHNKAMKDQKIREYNEAEKLRKSSIPIPSGKAKNYVSMGSNFDWVSRD